MVGSKTGLRSALRGYALDFIDELVPLSGSPPRTLPTPEDEGDWIPTQRPDHVSSGADEVVVHDNRSPESGVVTPVNIILMVFYHSPPRSTPIIITINTHSHLSDPSTRPLPISLMALAHISYPDSTDHGEVALSSIGGESAACQELQFRSIPYLSHVSHTHTY